MSTLPEIIDTMWTAISDGALERVGALGTETSANTVGRLWGKLRDHRKRKAQPETPDSREELHLSFLELLAADAEARSLAATIRADRSVVNVFHAPVTVDKGTIGIHNESTGR